MNRFGEILFRLAMTVTGLFCVGLLVAAIASPPSGSDVLEGFGVLAIVAGPFWLLLLILWPICRRR